MATISTIEGIGSALATKLRAGGIRSTGQLLTKGRTRQGRRTIAEKCNISEDLVLAWVNRADLMRVKGIGEEFSDLLERAGIDTVKELAKQQPESLHARCVRVANDTNVVRRIPSSTEVERWIVNARQLEPAIVR